MASSKQGQVRQVQTFRMKMDFTNFQTKLNVILAVSRGAFSVWGELETTLFRALDRIIRRSSRTLFFKANY